jgi:hypothetical protein
MGEEIQSVLAGEDAAWRNAIEENTVNALRDFFNDYPNSKRKGEADRLITQKVIKEYTPDIVLEYFGEDFLRRLCSDYVLDYDKVANYDEPPLRWNILPKNRDDIPSGYTDVFFWGVPSSGKTCALAAILSTIETHYEIDDPQIRIYGETYRKDLSRLLRDKTGYLPGTTMIERKQYMPFRIKRVGEDNYRDISFFDMAGEIFAYFYDIVYKNAPTEFVSIEHNEGELTGKQKNERWRRDAFNTLLLLLKSSNKKIHFFLIEYNLSAQNIEKQVKYLSAAATYFRDNNNIFENKTDAVYIMVTKADEIKAKDDAERAELAGLFLKKNFGAFVAEIENQCRKNHMPFKTKIFSIGDVYFCKICKINRKYSIEIIEELLQMVPYT